MTEQQEGAGALVTRPAQATRSLSLANEVWGPEEKKAVAAFLQIEAEDPALVPFLAISTQYGLDPFMREIWLIDTTKRIQVNGEWQDGPRQLTPAVGRDGLLKVARSTPEYEGFEAEVHCANDTFEVEHDSSDPNSPRVRHVINYSAGGEDPSAWRGAVIGAWCKVHVRGQRPIYYYASIREHGKVKRRNGEATGWQGAWSYTSAMILKSAVSMAHRLALGVTGIVPVDELKEGEPALEDAAAAEQPDTAEEVREVIAGLDHLTEELRGDLLVAVERANELAPFSWAPAKLSMRLTGRTVADAERVLTEVRKEIAAAETRAAEAEAVAEAEKITEAEVIVRAEDVQPGMTVRAEVDGATIEEEVLEVSIDDAAAVVEVTFAESGPVALQVGTELALISSPA
jgi:hypothetical protein